MPSPPYPRKELDRLEIKSERLFRVWRAAFCRRLAGELKTDRAVNNARENMEAAVIAAGNAYKALREAADG
jgi:hypothetical protein